MELVIAYAVYMLRDTATRNASPCRRYGGEAPVEFRSSLMKRFFAVVVLVAFAMVAMTAAMATPAKTTHKANNTKSATVVKATTSRTRVASDKAPTTTADKTKAGTKATTPHRHHRHHRHHHKSLNTKNLKAGAKPGAKFSGSSKSTASKGKPGSASSKASGSHVSALGGKPVVSSKKNTSVTGKAK
jgi:cobalamin biosynthesis Mg chelatase CobN